MDSKRTTTEQPRVFYYQGTLPPALALLLVAPLLFLVLSFAAVLIAGGAVAAVCLPFLLRGRLRSKRAEDGVITLERDQYSHVEHDAAKLPPR